MTQSYYAVARGKCPGVYTTWLECKKQIDHFKGARFKKFTTEKDAQMFVEDKYIHPMTQTTIDAFFKPVSDPTESENNLIAFTDGACSANGRKGAKASFAVVWPYHREMDYGSKLIKEEVQTNNRGEYTALIHALQQADQLDPSKQKTLIVYTDSQLMINSLTQWLPNWKKNGWRKSNGEVIANLDLVQTLDALMHQRKTVLKYVKAHTKEQSWEAIHNDIVDRLACGQLKF